MAGISTAQDYRFFPYFLRVFVRAEEKEQQQKKKKKACTKPKNHTHTHNVTLHSNDKITSKKEKGLPRMASKKKKRKRRSWQMLSLKCL